MENKKLLTDSFIKKGTEKMFFKDYLKLFGIPAGLLLVVAIILSIAHPVTTPDEGMILTKIQAPFFFFGVLVCGILFIVFHLCNFWSVFPKRRKYFVKFLQEVNKSRCHYLQKLIKNARREILELGRKQENFFEYLKMDVGYFYMDINEPFEKEQVLQTLFIDYVKTLVFLAELNIEYEKKKALLVGEVSPREADILVETIRANLLVTIQKRKEVDENEKEISQFITERQQLDREIETFMYKSNVLLVAKSLEQ